MTLIVFFSTLAVFLVFLVFIALRLNHRLKGKGRSEALLSAYRERTAQRINEVIGEYPEHKEEIEELYDSSLSSLDSVNALMDAITGSADDSIKNIRIETGEAIRKAPLGSVF